MNPVAKLEAYGIGLLIVVIAVTGMYFYAKHEGRVEGRKEVQVEFDAFKNDVAAKGLQAKQDKLDKEKADAKRIIDAESERDVARAGMRAAQAAERAARSRVPLTPAATGSSGQICFDQKALSAAVERYRGRVRGLAESGDEAALDCAALIKAWPQIPQSKDAAPK